jgi:hypothetical protein
LAEGQEIPTQRLNKFKNQHRQRQELKIILKAGLDKKNGRPLENPKAKNF